MKRFKVIAQLFFALLVLVALFHTLTSSNKGNLPKSSIRTKEWSGDKADSMPKALKEVLRNYKFHS